MLKLVWDTSAIVAIKEANEDGYSPAHSLWKDLSDGWIAAPYTNIIPALTAFEVSHAVSRNHAKGIKMLREFWIMGENEVVHPIDQALIYKAAPWVTKEGFIKLRGADLVIACVAAVEDAWLVTTDNHFNEVADQITVLNLNDSRETPRYRDRFPMNEAP